MNKQLLSTAALAAAVLSLVYSPPTTAKPVRIRTGKTILLPAPMGTSSKDLGKGFSATLDDVDDAGAIPSAYPSKVERVDDNRYESEVVLLKDDFTLNAQIRGLGFDIGAETTSGKRYAVYRVYQIKRVEKLKKHGKTKGRAYVYANKILWGWALLVLIEGDSSRFTSEVAVSLIGAGVDVRAVSESYALNTKVRLRGLEPRKKGDIPIATDIDEVQRLFKIPKEPVPILIEYVVARDVDTEEIEWSKAELLRAGDYKMSIDGIVVSQRKKSGHHWDFVTVHPPV